MSKDLDTRLRVAHVRQDGAELARLYAEAAKAAERGGNGPAAGFWMTQAYILALEAGLAEATALKAWLVAEGRESEA